MPDWSYRTVLAPVLFALPPRASRDLALSVMGLLGRAWPGRLLIDLLGHMRPPDGIGVTLAGLPFRSRMGLGCALDPELRATGALARFGCGFVEVGPVVRVPRRDGVIGRDDAAQSLVLPRSPGRCTAAGAAARLAGIDTAGAVVLARLDLWDTTDASPAGDADAIDALAPHVGGFTVRARDAGAAASIVALARSRGRPCFVVLPPILDAAGRASWIAAARTADGVVVDGAVEAGGLRLVGRPARAASLETVRAVRAGAGPALPILAGGGIHEPQDAIDLLAAGADLVAVDSGLVFGGPGLPKRINDALLPGAPAEARPALRPQESSWLWTFLIGLGMLAGSVLAFAIATTRVLLHYDEQFVGMSRHELAAVNDRLLPFLTHDRVTLAGAMAAIGALYTGLSWFGVRHGRHWAHVAIVASSVAGFVSFFLFLGFGYFDPFHAFVTAILFQLLLLAVHGRLGPITHVPAPMRVEDGAWRLGLWGQLGFVVQGAGFIGAGLVISAIGATHVFVAEDLEFLQTTAPALAAVEPHLVPLVAHDRATLGGMLLANGLVILLTALWGFRPGERWLWWTLLAAGLPGYAAAIGVHYVVGYHSTFHLAPAFIGLGLYAAALAASWPSLCRRG
jgi:hypothetical protein